MKAIVRHTVYFQKIHVGKDCIFDKDVLSCIRNILKIYWRAMSFLWCTFLYACLWYEICEEDIALNHLRKLFPAVLVVVLMIAMVLPVFATPEELPEGVTFTDVNEIVYATDMVNVRKGPGLDYDIITTLRYGEAVRRIGVGSNGWSRVEYLDEEAYMYTTLISTSRPSNFGGSTLDDNALKQQIGLVNGLNRTDYTVESWQMVATAMTEAEEALVSESQNLVDEALENLKAAVGSLIKVDYSGLDRALLAVDEFAKTDAYGGLWETLADAIQRGHEALASGEQTAVDVATQEILALLDQMEAIDADRETPDVIVQEVQVEVPPTSEYCNIPQHRVWPVIACISLAINACLLAVIGVYVFKKRKTQRDDTPLVDYDIDDDTF